MKTHSLRIALLAVITFDVSGGARLAAKDLQLHIKIPNPIPRIARRIEKVGDFIARKAERIEIAVEDDEYRRRPGRLPPLPPAAPGEVIVTTETITTSPGPLPVRPEYRDPLVYESPRLAPSPPPPASVQIAPSYPVVPQGRPLPGRTSAPATPTSVDALQPSATVPPREHVAAAPSLRSGPALAPTSPPLESAEPNRIAAKPAPSPEPPFGKPVPGRPGLVYPPGLKETQENMIDVRDIAPGTKVRDPATKTVFRVP